MPRHNGNKAFNKKRNSGQHQRRRSTRGQRAISKFVKYKWYTEPAPIPDYGMDMNRDPEVDRLISSVLQLMERKSN